MKRFDMILVFFVFGISSSMLFQNCGEMKSSNPSSLNESAGEPGGGDNRIVPAFLANRSFPLDNKTLAGQSRWSVGSDDIFFYETDYLATYESTLVTITGRDQVAYLTVTSDDCNGEKALSFDESVELSQFYENYIPVTEEKVLMAGEVTTPGCAFPRLGMDLKGTNIDGTPASDFEIYFASRECTPGGDLYVSDLNGNDPQQALLNVQAFFNAQIDQVCGL